MELDKDKELMELISATRAGSNDAFAELIDKYKPMLNGVMSKYSLDERDAFSELCLSFHRAVLTYDKDIGTTFGLYAKICVQRTASDLASDKGKEAARIIASDIDVDDIAVPGGIEVILEHRERSAYFLSVARSELSELEFGVFHYWMLGYTTAETASSLGITPKQVDNAKNRMWKKLRSRLTPED